MKLNRNWGDADVFAASSMRYALGLKREGECVVRRIAIIGGGPAGLMAAESAAGQGVAVSVHEAMPTVGRKLLMAGKSGLNITHAEAKAVFDSRYGDTQGRLQSALDAFPAEAVRAWCADLGVETFVGSSGKVFPKTMKASPLLRAWLGRLDAMGVDVRTRHRWVGYEADKLAFETPDGRQTEQFDAVVLALGGASWPRLGSNAEWVPWLEGRHVPISPFRPANCGFETSWSSFFAERFAGQPIKSVVAKSAAGSLPGEFVVTRWGIEGSLVYAHSAALRDSLEANGRAGLELDLVPARSLEQLTRDLARQPAKASFANRLRKAARLDGVKMGLLRQLHPEAAGLTPAALAVLIKALRLPVLRPRPIEQAISVSGGVAWDGLSEDLMLKAIPGTFLAGEMVDWEAPTGGYLLTACLAMGRAAGLAAARYCREEGEE